MSKKSAKEDIPADDPELETVDAEGLEEGDAEETEVAADGAGGDAAKAAPKPQSDLKKLVLKGKAQGFLTYAEINDHLPENMHDTDQIEVVVNMINDMGIEVVDKAPDTDSMTLKRDNSEDQEVVEEVRDEPAGSSADPPEIGDPSHAPGVPRASEDIPEGGDVSPAPGVAPRARGPRPAGVDAESQAGDGGAEWAALDLGCRMLAAQGHLGVVSGAWGALLWLLLVSILGLWRSTGPRSS